MHKFQPQILIPPLFFLLLAIVSTWPLAGSLTDHLPLGTENAATVPFLNVWTVWWNADRAADGYSGYWDAPVFYPTEKTFTFSEPMPLSVVAAPIIWITGNRILAYNCLLILWLCLNGWMAFRLLKHLGFNRSVAWIGGVMTELLPLIHSWTGVLQLVPVFGILWTITALHRFGKYPVVSRGIVLGTAFAVTYLLCAYYGLFLFVLMVFSGGWLLGKKILQVKLWKSLVPGILTAAVLCLPVVTAQHNAILENAFQHPEDYIAALSASTTDYGRAPYQPLIPVLHQDDTPAGTGFKLFPGFIKSGLAMVGIVWGLLSFRRRSLTLFCLTMLLLSYVLSLGPHFQISGRQPYMLLVDFIPGFAQVRNVFRFSVFVHIMLTLLAVMGLQGVMGLAGRYIRHPGASRTAGVAILSLGILAIVEILPTAQPLYKVPDHTANQSWIGWLNTRTPADSKIVCIPFPLWPGIQNFEQEGEWMYWQTFHHRRMLNGYSGFFPKTFLDLRIPMAGFPSQDIIGRLCSMGVDICVVRQDSIQGVSAGQYSLTDPRIEAVFSDDSAGIDIYRLR